MRELIVIEDLKPEIFAQKGGIDGIIENVKSHVVAFRPDMTTDSGRKDIASFAHKIARTKTGIDNLGKEFASELKKTVKSIDADRARAWDALEAMQKEVRQPLTDWETAEKERVEKHKANLAEIVNAGNANPDLYCLEVMQERLKEIESDNTDWQEFTEVAKEYTEKAISQIKAAIEIKQKRETEARELEQLRKQAAERAQKDREEEIRKEAEAKVKRDAELAIKLAADKAEAERLAIVKQKEEAELAAQKAEQARIFAEEQAKREAAAAIELAAKVEAEKKAALELAEKKAEEARIAAEEKAKKEADEAVLRERARAEAEQKAQAELAAQREANIEHKRKINNSIKAALIVGGDISDVQAEAIIIAMNKNEIPHITINY